MNESRPRYEPPQPRQIKFKASWQELLAVTIIVGILQAVLSPLFNSAMVSRPRKTACLSNGKRLSRAVMMYSQDHDEHLPLAENWYEATDLYYNDKTLVCPERPNHLGVGYAMDERLSGRSMDSIGAPHDKRPLLYESSNFTPNAHDSGTSFAGRHTNQTGWVGFVDGHVKIFQKATYPHCK